jgi:hypothetical protein
LKRQGRAEEHIPLFYPETVEEYDEIYAVMVKKLGLKTSVAKLSEVSSEDQFLGLSGSDLEAVLVRATLEARHHHDVHGDQHGTGEQHQQDELHGLHRGSPSGTVGRQ